VVEIVMREKPGYIIYEDEFQVAAIPYGIDSRKVL
jgi:hypothetical protein